MIAASALIVLLGPAVAMATEAEDNLKAFPPAEAGMVRHVLLLPAHDDEASRKVELIVGQTVETDGVNRYFFGGKVEAVTIDGWGFTRYVVRRLGPMAGTLIAVDPDAPKVNRFVPLGGEPYLVRYNSRLPLVVYLPEGAELRYRIWTASPESKPVPQG